MKYRTYKSVGARSVFLISVLVALLTILGVYFWGLGHHNTFFENSIISTTILSLTFFVFITVNLYRGVKLKHDFGNMDPRNASFDVGLDLSLRSYSHATPELDVGEGLAGILFGIILWIAWGVLVAIVLWLFSYVVLVSIAAFVLMLYWIFFRAMRLVFRNSAVTKGRIGISIRYGVLYTILYNSWVYGIFLLVEFLRS